MESMSNFNLLKVIEVSKITSEAVTLTFEVPEKLKKKYSFISGQYLSLEVIINNLKVRRSYSICSNPNDPLRVGIKKVSGGVFSSYAVDKIKSGDLISVGTPEGRFQYKSNSKKETITGIAAGSGITPILSIAYSVLNSNKQNEFRLIYGNKSPSQEMFTSEINTLKILYSERLKVINVYSQSNEDEARFGRIDNSIINYYHKEYGIADKYFICGPEAMIYSTSDDLLTKKVSKDNILYELFTISKTNTKVTNKGITKLDIVYDDETHALEVVSGKTVLDAAIESDVDVPYSCQGGVCSSCIARVVEGSAKMKTNQILTEEEIDEGLVLTCQAEPESKYLKVDFDDV